MSKASFVIIGIASLISIVGLSVLYFGNNILDFFRGIIYFFGAYTLFCFLPIVLFYVIVNRKRR